MEDTLKEMKLEEFLRMYLLENDIPISNDSLVLAKKLMMARIETLLDINIKLPTEVKTFDNLIEVINFEMIQKPKRAKKK